jgi:hypothetical protein
VARIEIMTRLGLRFLQNGDYANCHWATIWPKFGAWFYNGVAIVGPPHMLPFGDFSTKKKTSLNYLLNLLGHYGSRLGVSKLTIMHK